MPGAVAAWSQAHPVADCQRIEVAGVFAPLIVARVMALVTPHGFMAGLCFSGRLPQASGERTIDHPATQAHKRQRLAELGWVQPANLHYLPVDFTRQGVADRLAASPFDPSLPVFFSWLGVTYYLPKDVVLDTLREIVLVARSGSSIVFDYLDGEAFVSQKCSPRVQRMLNHVESLGEPMQTGFDPGELSEELSRAGLELVENLCPWDIHNRWFMGRRDHYRACEHVHFVHALVI